MNEDTRTALARFDDAMREKALTSGQPAPRTAAGFPGFTPGRGYLVFRFDPAKRRLMAHLGGQAVPATAEHVSQAFRDPKLGALALDRKAATAMIALIPEEDRTLALSVAAHRAAPVSGRYTELAAACSARYYAPAGMDMTSGDAWLATFGAATGEAQQVAERAATPEGTARGGEGALLASLRSLISEASAALESALNPGTSAGDRAWIDRNYAFELCEALTEFTGALTAFDPLTRKRGVLSGDLVRAEVLPAGGRASARVRLAAPVSVKQGEEVAVLPADGRSRPGPGTCSLGQYVAEDDGLHALLASTPKGTGLDVVSAAGEGATVLLGNVKPPFLKVPTKAYTRWSGKKLSDRHPRPRKRPVPSYIVLAGGGPDVTGVPTATDLAN